MPRNHVDLQHLLGFTYEDHRDHRDHRDHAPRRHRRQPPRLLLTGLAYVNAHHRFVVLTPPGGDPNTPPDAATIIRVVVHPPAACPICLSDVPVAPRMLHNCGHVLCLACMLRTGSRVRECPLCLAPFRSERLVPVVYEEPPETGLRLVARPHGWGWCMGAERWRSGEFPEWPHHDDVDRWGSRVVLGDRVYALEVLERETGDVATAHEVDSAVYGSDPEGAEFTTKALEWLDQQAAVARALPGRTVQKQFRGTGPVYLFYTAPGVPHRLVAPLDVRVLREVYGDYAAFPDVCPRNTVASTSGDLTQDMATSTCKFIGHVPFGSPLEWAELRWDRGSVLREVWARFGKELEARDKRRRRRDGEEERRRKEALVEEEQKVWGMVEAGGGGFVGVPQRPSPPEAFPGLGAAFPGLGTVPAHTAPAPAPPGTMLRKLAWGQDVPVLVELLELEDDGWLEEALKTMESGGKGKGRRKKKLVLMNTGR